MSERLHETQNCQSTLRFYASLELKRAVPIAFFTIVTLALYFAAVRAPSSTSPLLPIVSTLFLWAGIWLEWRRGWPGIWHGPACELNPAGITFWPKKSRRQFLPWDDLDLVGHDMSDSSMIFTTKKPETYDRRYLLVLKRPPYTAQGLKSPDGEYLANVLHRYWDEETKTAVSSA